MDGSEEQLDNAHLMRLAGRFSRRVRGFAKAHHIRWLTAVLAPLIAAQDEMPVQAKPAERAYEPERRPGRGDEPRDCSLTVGGHAADAHGDPVQTSRRAPAYLDWIGSCGAVQRHGAG
jgi:hypothetical protein